MKRRVKKGIRKSIAKKLSMKNKYISLQLCYEEYSSLRSEINSIQEQQRNIWIAMYTLYVALFVLAMECKSSYILLLTYMILIPFQYIINKQNWSVQKLSTYIRCFFENNQANIHWEGLHLYPKYQEHHRKCGDDQWIQYMGASVLGFISTAYFIYNGNNANLILNIFLMLFSIGIFLVLLMINLQYKRDYCCELMNIMQDYKRSINKNQ